MKKVAMTQEDREYFKKGIKTLCGTELIFATKVINDPDIKKDVRAKRPYFYE